jgi:hypothetical protein
LSDNKKDDHRQNRQGYADVYAAISPICAELLPDIGITRTSAYPHLGSPVGVNGPPALAIAVVDMFATTGVVARNGTL